MDQDFDGQLCVILMATYDDWRSVAHIIPELDARLAGLNLRGQVVIVDDSSDDVDGKDLIANLSLSVIESIEEIQLGSNQGNQRAMAVGMAYVARHYECDYLIAMDSDNEDKPEDVTTLLVKCRESKNAKIIFAERTRRSEGRVFKLFYGIYKRLFKALTGKSISVGNFCVVPGGMIRRIAHISELWNHFPISIIRSGLSYDMAPTDRGTRLYGQGRMNLIKLIIHAFSGFSIHADVIAVRLILFASGLGAFFVVFLVFTSVMRFATEMLIPGWASMMLMQIFLLFAVVTCTALIVLTLVLSMRMQPPMIPYHDYEKFIFETKFLFPVGQRGHEGRSAS